MSSRLVLLRLLGLLVPLAVLLAAVAAAPHASAAVPSTPAPLTVRSPAFANGAPIPARYSCDGEGVSPPLEWGDVPDGTRSIAILVTDPDAPRGPFVHWLVYDLPPDTRSLPAGVGSKGEVPKQASLGLNSNLQSTWTSVCPPSGEHRYVVRVFALDRRLAGLHAPTGGDFERAAQGHVLAEGRLTGTYTHRGG
jgi:Raf kinase inhibitor-like YbhB/YbcL family protein